MIKKFLKIYDPASDLTNIPEGVIFYAYPTKGIIGWFYYDNNTSSVLGDHRTTNNFKKDEVDILLFFKKEILKALNA